MQTKIRVIKSLANLFLAISCFYCALAYSVQCHGEVLYRVTPLLTNGQLGATFSYPAGINRFGDVCGTYKKSNYLHAPFLYKDSTGVGCLLTNTPLIDAFASGINDLGQIALMGTTGNGDCCVYRYSPGVGILPLGSLYDCRGDAAGGINNFGQIVGSSDAVMKGAEYTFPFLYGDTNGMVQLEGPNGMFEGSADAINDLGHILFHANWHAYLYSSKTNIIDLGQGSGSAINDLDVVAGAFGEYDYHAAIYSNGTVRLLTPAGTNSEAYGINNYNIVVGTIYPLYARVEMFVWSEKTGPMMVNSLIDTNWHISSPYGINDSGQIAAQGFAAGGSSSDAVRLDPIPPKISLLCSNTNVSVSWSPAWPGVILEGAEDVRAATWEVLPTGGTNIFTMPLTNQMRFFRLNLDALRGLCCAPNQ
jgi:uncharacterized membrane protein